MTTTESSAQRTGARIYEFPRAKSKPRENGLVVTVIATAVFVVLVTWDRILGRDR